MLLKELFFGLKLMCSDESLRSRIGTSFVRLKKDNALICCTCMLDDLVPYLDCEISSWQASSIVEPSGKIVPVLDVRLTPLFESVTDDLFQTQQIYQARYDWVALTLRRKDL